MSDEYITSSLFSEYKNVVAIQKELIESEQKRANERLKVLEGETSKINELTNSIAIMAISVENLTKEIQNQRDDINTLMSDIDKRVKDNEKDILSLQNANLDSRLKNTEKAVSDIQNAPAKTWSNIKTLIMTGSVGAIVSAIMAYVISMIHITH